MDIISKIITNGYILMIPILLWNIIFTSKLPSCYSPDTFNNNIPSSILICENIFRIIVFIFPLFLSFNFATEIGKKGLIIYCIGCLLYFSSWLILIYLPNSMWSKSIFGFAAPAYTPIIWLIGIAFLLDNYYFNLKYNAWHLIIPSIGFSFFHILHTITVYLRCTV